ncbi:MAG: hypothetical protein K0S65_1479, partial [Labilithrix sp.]|nr:hypothetical protein [Labilithrix sp.]
MSRQRNVVAALLFAGTLGFGCRFDPAYRDFPDPATTICTDGVVECRNASLVECRDNQIVVLDDCGVRGQACAPQLRKCTPCLPGERTCDGATVLLCDP